MSQVTSPPGVDPSMSDGPSDASGSGSNFATGTSVVAASGISPYLYFYIVTLLWILMFFIWIVVLVLQNRRVQQWAKQPPPPHGEDTSVSEGGAGHPPQTNTTQKFQRQQSNAQTTILVLLIVASLMALSLAIVTHFSCDFIDLPNPVSLNLVPVGQRGAASSFVQIEITTIGMWALGSSNIETLGPNYFLVEGLQDESCFRFTGDEAWLLGQLGGSGQFTAARVSSVLATILGSFSLLFFIWSACYPSRRTRVRYLGWTMFLVTVLQLVPFVLFETEVCASHRNCSLSFGGTTNVTATMFWFFCTLVASAFPPMVMVQETLVNEQPNSFSEP